MTDEIKVKAKPGPKAKVDKAAITKKVAGPTRKKPRVPMHASVSTKPKEANDPDYYYRKCAGYGKGKIERYLAAGYEYVCYEGTNEKIMYPGGTPRWLMRQPMKYRLEDIENSKNKVKQADRAVNQQNAVDKSGAVPDYIPKGNEGVVSRDNPLS